MGHSPASPTAAVDSLSWSQPVSFLEPQFSQLSHENTEALNPRLPFGCGVLHDCGTLETCLLTTFNSFLPYC